MNSTWPPPFTVKKHTRARRVKLKISLQGLELIIPPRFNVKHIPDILKNNREWIEKKLGKTREKLQFLEQQPLPNEIRLSAINQVWRMTYIPSDNKKIKLFSQREQELVLLGDIQNKKIVKEILNAWVKQQANFYLPLLLKACSEKLQLTYKKISIRSQKTRWGSCTSKKVISLNYKLMFLPAHLVTHVLIHELCHTVFLNHSSAFWRLVASFDSDWKSNARALRLSHEWLPVWI